MLSILKQIATTGLRSETPMFQTTATVLPRADADAIHGHILEILGKALTIRAVDAGSCNGCELELHALNNPYYNIEGLGIKFVASPRHADMLLVTGPVTRNMALALRRTYEATPDPKLVVAVGDCGRDGGVFCGSLSRHGAENDSARGVKGAETNYACLGGVDKVIPVDVIVPGCPPEPLALLEGILAAVQRRVG